ncbi:hypothetical protein BOTBODRAFT_169886 [Botryobasidium botryosum FD-172 SS1]|uniref:PEBP-like protein n=1 Tax=Botryobasidium botryosum (strain FD-172 SS1) TaxID=930990 RepID=A0A067N6W8_BOTB1|nr:hypothetical protein BOTBODRAFT_169886 [Botryobasidium botryosum FD-172 SS1]
MLNTVFLAALCCLSVSLVRAHPASPLSVAVVKQQFINADIVPDVVPKFDPIGVAVLNYSTTLQRLSNGQDVTQGNVTQEPVVYIHGTAAAEAVAGGPFNVTTIKYTVLAIDGNTAGSSNPNGYNLHYLRNDYVYGQNNDHTVTLNTTTAPVVPYQGPAPPSGSGPHRYIWLVYAQPANFVAPSTPVQGSGVALFNLTQYTAAANFGDPIVGTYFTVQVGPANASVAVTSAVDSTTLPQYTPTSTSSGGHATMTGMSNAGLKSEVSTGAAAIVVFALLFFTF